jgi:hypothetical protein
MGWIVVVSGLVVLAVLVWRRERRGSRSGFAILGERGQDDAHRAEMELRTASGRTWTGGNGGPSL